MKLKRSKTPLQDDIIKYLTRVGDRRVTQTEMARVLSSDQSTISVALALMAKKGKIEIIDTDKNGRARYRILENS